MRTFFKDFVRWYNNKEVNLTLEALQKVVGFFHNKGIDMLNVACTLPNLAKIYLHQSSTAKFCPLTESDRDLLDELREDIVGGPAIVFTKLALVDETFIRDSTNWCKTLVAIDASQLHPFSIWQAMSIGLFIR